MSCQMESRSWNRRVALDNAEGSGESSVQQTPRASGSPASIGKRLAAGERPGNQGADAGDLRRGPEPRKAGTKGRECGGERVSETRDKQGINKGHPSHCRASIAGAPPEKHPGPKASRGVSGRDRRLPGGRPFQQGDCRPAGGFNRDGARAPRPPVSETGGPRSRGGAQEIPGGKRNPFITLFCYWTARALGV